MPLYPQTHLHDPVQTQPTIDRLGDLLAPRKKDKKLGSSALAVMRARRRSASKHASKQVGKGKRECLQAAKTSPHELRKRGQQADVPVCATLMSWTRYSIACVLHVPGTDQSRQVHSSGVQESSVNADSEEESEEEEVDV
eukprot:1157928-Pelagomonas_calceolata.AAC.2